MLMRLRDNLGNWNQSSCSSALSHAIMTLAFYSDSRWLSGDILMIIMMRHSIADFRGDRYSERSRGADKQVLLKYSPSWQLR